MQFVWCFVAKMVVMVHCRNWLREVGECGNTWGKLHQRDAGYNSGSSLNLIVYNNGIYCWRQSSWDLSLSLPLSHVGATGPWAPGPVSSENLKNVFASFSCFKDARTSLFFDCWRRPIVAHIKGSGMSDMNVRDWWDITIAVAYC